MTSFKSAIKRYYIILGIISLFITAPFLPVDNHASVNTDTTWYGIKLHLGTALYAVIFLPAWFLSGTSFLFCYVLFILICWLSFILIGIHPIQGWTVTTWHGVTRKRITKILKHKRNLFRKNLQLTGVFDKSNYQWCAFLYSCFTLFVS